MFEKKIDQTPGGVDFDLYTRRPDLWAIAAALRHATAYRTAIWELLSDEDKEALRSHKKLYQVAVEQAQEARKAG